ncbi:uncharacterized protein LOC107469276 [Arachis duranensis]|uniref:Uncharacterized protein LOC107469276 n=1 Tax=Arachis duranensis TaxID=130453 RepID=A0A6P4BW52_ARADU|nr:uncharacterized protein LOC107469276 [Arachis duranensis]
MKPAQWVSEHKLTTIGALWATGVGASLMAYARTKSRMKPSLRLIHARLNAQALTLAVLSGAAAYHYYANINNDQNLSVDEDIRIRPSSSPNVKEFVEWDLHSPF